jgi:putative membrane protein
VNKKGLDKMEQERASNMHYFLRAAILSGFAMYIVYLVKTDHMIYYIAPRMENYVKLSAIALYAIAICQIYVGLRAVWGRSEACDCEHPPSRSLFKNSIVYGMFLLPLLFGFMLPDAAMSSTLAAKKGVNLNSASSLKPGGEKLKGVSTAATDNSLSPLNNPTASIANTVVSTNNDAAKQGSNGTDSSVKSTGNTSDNALQEMFKADKYTQDFANLGMKLYKKDVIQVKEEGFIEALSAMDLFMDNFVGKKIEISGFVYREEEMKPNQFVVARFQLQCCSADASPFGVMVEFDKSQNFTKDTWINVSGTIGKTTYAENEIMKISAAKIETIEAPKSPYVYPNYEYLIQP